MVRLRDLWRFNLSSDPTGGNPCRPLQPETVYDRQGERFETEFQPGSGSYDPLAGLALSQRLGRWSFDTNVLYVFANKGAQRTNLGDRFQYNGALSYRLFGSAAEETPGGQA